MASGRKNRGSRHRSHRHKQQKTDDSAESDSEQNLRHGPMPEPTPVSNPSPPWTMEPLPPNVEGPSVLKPLDTENVERRSHYETSKGPQSVVAKRRKESSAASGGDSSSELDRWDGGGSDENALQTLLATAKSSVAMDVDGLDRKDSKLENDTKGKGKATPQAVANTKNSGQQDGIFQDCGTHVASKANIGRDFESVAHSVVEADNLSDCNNQEQDTFHSIGLDPSEIPKIRALDIDGSSLQVDAVIIEPERKRKKIDESQKPRRSEEIMKFSNVASWEEEEAYHPAFNKDKHLDEKHKGDVLKLDNGRGGKDDKDREQKKKSERSRDDRSSEGKKEVMRSDFVDDWPEESMHKDTKERDDRVSEGRHKESRSKESRYKDEREKESWSKFEGDTHCDEKLKSDSGSKKGHRDDKAPGAGYHEDKVKKGKDQHTKDDRLKVKERVKTEEDNDKDRSEKYKDDGSTNAKYKHEKKKADVDQSNYVKKKESSRTDSFIESKEKYEKKFERTQDYAMGSLKSHTDKGRFDDGKDIEKHEGLRGSRERNGRHMENASKESKFSYGNEKDAKYRDDLSASERDHKEKAKDDVARRNKHRDDSRERRWGGIPQEERSRDGKDMIDAQKHVAETDDRQRYDGNDGNYRADTGKSGRRYNDKSKDDRTISRKVASKESSVGEKNEKYNEHTGRQVKVSDEQSEFGGNSESEARDSKILTTQGDRSVQKPARSASQDQERLPPVTPAKDSNASENKSKRTRDSDGFGTVIMERDYARSRNRPMVEVSDSVHEKSGRRNKFEGSVSVSSSSGTRRAREQNRKMIDNVEPSKQYLGFDEEVRSWEPRASNQDSDDERQQVFTHDRSRDSKHSLSPPGAYGNEEFLNYPDSKDGTPLKRKRHSSSHSAGSMKARQLDDVSNERHDWSTQSNKVQSDGPMNRQNRFPGSSSSLPPPPPYRPGMDNPAMMGAPSNFVDDSNSREGARYDRKGGGSHLRRSDMVGPGDAWGNFNMGNWSVHNQSPVLGPGNMFSPFPHMGSGPFFGMGQQFHVPQMFAPRPSTEIGFGGTRFQMADGSSPFPGHGSMMGWHRFPDRNETHHPASGFMEASWFGHPEWDRFSQGVSGWEGVQEPWQNHAADAKLDREGLYQVKHKEETFNAAVDPEKMQVVDDQAQERSQISPVLSTGPHGKADYKDGKRNKQRLQMFLLHADISAQLVDNDLYKEYLKFLPSIEAEKKELRDHTESGTFVDEDLEFDVDSEAQELLLTQDPLAMVMPSLSDEVYKNVLKMYKRHNHKQKSVIGSFILPESVGTETFSLKTL